MDVTKDEPLVRQMLVDLTAGQPPAPQARYRLVRRRALRNRLTRAAGTLAVVAVMAAVAVGVGVGRPAGSAPPAAGTRARPGWALPWPDHRDGSVPQRVLRGAVTSWRHRARLGGSELPLAATPGPTVIWYVGQTAAHGRVVVVVFEVRSAVGNELVTGWALASDVMHGQPGWSPRFDPWGFYYMAAPRDKPGLAVSMYVAAPGAATGVRSDNWIVVLAAPDVQAVSWAESQQGGSDSAGIRVTSRPTSRGLLIADAGQLTGRVNLIALFAGNRNVLAHHVWVGMPGVLASQIPRLEPPAPVIAPHGFSVAQELTGQGTTIIDLRGMHGRLAILGRCYGPSSIVLTYTAGLTQTRIGAIPCDDRRHEVIAKARLGPHHAGAGILLGIDALTAFRVVIGTVPG